MGEKKNEEQEKMGRMIAQNEERKDRADERVFERALSVEILRGERKIGENLIEVMGYDMKVLLECGRALDPDEESARIEEYVRQERYAAVIVTHFHEDHSGLLRDPIAADAIYMGARTFDLLRYRGMICDENAGKVVFMSSEEPFHVGEITFIPHLCDHSAFDSYMIEITDGVKRILYTGDFRSHGRKSFPALLRRLPKKVDLLISEKTLREEKGKSEWELEREAVELMRSHREVFILQSASNVDRLVSFYRAAKRAQIPLLVAPIHTQIVRHIETAPEPKNYENCYLYTPRRLTKESHDILSDRYGEKFIGRSIIAELPRFAMMIHTGMGDYIDKLAKTRDLSGAVLVYSMWEGYKEDFREFLSNMERLGIKVVDLHVSGHADGAAIKALIQMTDPDEIVYVHTNAESTELSERSGENLYKIIRERAAAKGVDADSVSRVRAEVDLIRVKGDGEILLAMTELCDYMRSEHIAFSIRGVGYSSLYCSYLLGIAQYDPKALGLSFAPYAEGDATPEFDIARENYDQVIAFLRGKYSDFSETYFYDKRDGKTKPHGAIYRLMKDAVGKERTIALFRVDSSTLDGSGAEQDRYEDEAVYEYMARKQLLPPWFSLENIQKNRPKDLLSLAKCASFPVRVTERNIAFHVARAARCYSIAKASMREENEEGE